MIGNFDDGDMVFWVCVDQTGARRRRNNILDDFLRLVE
jgi:hypothetical protein